MNKEEYYAHSGKDSVEPQTYREHITSVIDRAVKNAEQCLVFCGNKSVPFVDIVRKAALMHDLGKLDKQNQEVLGGIKKGRRLPINHVDAGVALLKSKGYLEPAMLAYAHHIGLCYPRSEEIEKRNEIFRDISIKEYTDNVLDELVKIHNGFLCEELNVVKTVKSDLKGIDRRIALSCLVDADFGDTAEHYQREKPVATPECRWKERLAKLDEYVESLPSSKRSEERAQIYSECRNANYFDGIGYCDSPVGTGKTTAVMAYLLKMAAEKNLRHIIVVLPYTNIIKQSVEVYRKALVISGEKPEEVVAEHHHQADFSSFTDRQFATLWTAPIIVTTSVQFFETIAGNHPARLRKIHQLPGSAVFVDEVHSAVPSAFWGVTWEWLEYLTTMWGSHFVLGSGTLPRLWENEEIVKKRNVVVKSLIGDELSHKNVKKEQERIEFETIKNAFTKETLKDFVVSKEGPRLVIMNTVQSAAVFADYLSKNGYVKKTDAENGDVSGVTLFHLSTALTPNDRDKVVKSISNKLKTQKEKDWIVVATSCIEAGMDFSFKVAFRETCSTASMIQTGGRVNRHGEDAGVVYDFRIQDDLFNENKQFSNSRKVLLDLFEGGYVKLLAPSMLVTEAMKWELKNDGKRDELLKKEHDADYPGVADLYRIIDAGTKLVVVEKKLIEKLKTKISVTPIELVRGSVQIRSYRINNLALELIQGHKELYEWKYEYDGEFLGYMAGVLPLLEMKKDKYAII